jgi:hypothetical protein
MTLTPHTADAVRLPAPIRVLAFVLLLWVPFSLALEASAGLSRLVHFGVPAIALLLLRIGVTGLGVAAGRALWAVQPSAVQLAQAWLVLDVAVTALTLATPYFPSNRLPGARGRDLAMAVAFNAAWFVYLRVSARVKACWARA